MCRSSGRRLRLSPWLLFVLTLAALYWELLDAISLTGLKGPSLPSKARVNLDYAQYHGKALPNGVNEFLGMRYAAAPKGDLRFRAPVEPQKEGFKYANKVWEAVISGRADYSRILAERELVVWTDLLWDQRISRRRCTV